MIGLGGGLWQVWSNKVDGGLLLLGLYNIKGPFG